MPHKKLGILTYVWNLTREHYSAHIVLTMTQKFFTINFEPPFRWVMHDACLYVSNNRNEMLNWL